MLQRGWSFVVWALVALSAFYWGLHWVVGASRAPAGTRAVALDSAPRADLTRVLGAAPVQAAAAVAEEPDASRFKLVGVVAPRDASAQREGLALIAVDGKLPRSYRPGAAIDGDWVLQSVRQRGASIGPAGGAARVALEMPPPTQAATGTLGVAQPEGARQPGAFGSNTPPLTPPPAAAPGQTPAPFPQAGGRLRVPVGPNGLPGLPGLPAAPAPGVNPPRETPAPGDTDAQAGNDAINQ